MIFDTVDNLIAGLAESVSAPDCPSSQQLARLQMYRLRSGQVVLLGPRLALPRSTGPIKLAPGDNVASQGRLWQSILNCRINIRCTIKHCTSQRGSIMLRRWPNLGLRIRRGSCLAVLGKMVGTLWIRVPLALAEVDLYFTPVVDLKSTALRAGAIQCLAQVVVCCQLSRVAGQSWDDVND